MWFLHLKQELQPCDYVSTTIIKLQMSPLAMLSSLKDILFLFLFLGSTVKVPRHQPH